MCILINASEQSQIRSFVEILNAYIHFMIQKNLKFMKVLPALGLLVGAIVLVVFG
jgi:hypothetical protein